jgi:hypothetical protein
VKKSRIRKKSAVRSLFGIFGAGSLTLFSTAAVAGALSLVYAAIQMPDSLVATWLVRPLAIASVGTVGASGGLPTNVGTSTSVTNPAPVALKPMKLGMNIGGPVYYAPSRAFMNLASDSGWYVTPAGGGATDSYFDANRNVVKVLPGDQVYRFILRPTAVFQKKSVDVVCKWDGVGTILAVKPGGVKNLVMGTNSMRYTHLFENVNTGWMPIYLTAVDANNPIRNIDCREAGADPNALFDPTFLASVKKFSSLRFLKWQNVEDNKPITWATRTTPAMGQIVGGLDGVAIEHMIALANETKTDPWFCMPWNADDDYIRRFAQLVRDTLDPSLTAYVETSNEVWNWVYPVTFQAQQEGLAHGLTGDTQVAIWLRYAEKTIQVMDIWRDVFQGQSSRIVRVAAMQNAWPASVQAVLAFRDTPQHIDAIASAPYFDANLATYPGDGSDLSDLFAQLRQTLDWQMGNAKQFKQMADQYHLRFVTYEAGQHVSNAPPDKTDLLYQIQHDPRMGQLYTYYLNRWNNEIGDQMTLFSDVGGSSVFGAWGLLDYIGQSPNAAAKAKAVMLFQASIGR